MVTLLMSSLLSEFQALVYLAILALVVRFSWLPSALFLDRRKWLSNTSKSFRDKGCFSCKSKSVVTSFNIKKMEAQQIVSMLIGVRKMR
jgi:hypothetical protein